MRVPPPPFKINETAANSHYAAGTKPNVAWREELFHRRERFQRNRWAGELGMPNEYPT